MKINYGKVLIWSAIISTPAAMVAFLTLEISKSVNAPDTLIWRGAILIGAFLSSVGIESTGILSGHALERFTRRKEWVRAFIVGVLLIVYTAVAMRILWENDALRFVPLVAAVVYILAALIDGVEHVEVIEQEQQTKLNEFNLEEQAKEAEHRREMESKQLEIDAANALQIQLAHERGQTEIALAAEKTKATIANAEARKAKLSAKVDESKPAKGESHTKAADLSGTPLLVFEALQRNPKASNVEIAESLPITPQRVGQIRKELNGAIKEAS